MTQADVIQPAGPGEALFRDAAVVGSIPNRNCNLIIDEHPGDGTREDSEPSLAPDGITCPALPGRPLIVGLVGTNSPAPILFWLGLAAIWFGLADAVLGNLLDPTFAPGCPRTVPRRSLSGCRCWRPFRSSVPARLVDRREHGGPKGPALAVLVLLVLASAVGLALGLLIVVLSPRPTLAWAILPVIVLLMWFFGGQWRPCIRCPQRPG